MINGNLNILVHKNLYSYNIKWKEKKEKKKNAMQRINNTKSYTHILRIYFLC